MKRTEDFEDHPWFIIPVPPGREPIMRSWNIALISALAFIVLGVFAMTLTPELGHASAGFHYVPSKIEKAPASASSENNATALQGIRVHNLTPNIARDLMISTSAHAVVITSVDPSSAAATAGLDRGDVIQEVNRKSVRDINEYHEALAGNHGQSVLLLINRAGSTHYIVVQPQ